MQRIGVPRNPAKTTTTPINPHNPKRSRSRAPKRGAVTTWTRAEWNRKPPVTVQKTRSKIAWRRQNDPDSQSTGQTNKPDRWMKGNRRSKHGSTASPMTPVAC